MGIANKKCIACGGGAVLVKHAPELEGEPAYLRYWCCACDYKWEEPPLYVKEKEKNSGIPCDVRDVPETPTFHLGHLEAYLTTSLELLNKRQITLTGSLDPAVHRARGTITMKLGDAALVVVMALRKEGVEYVEC